MAKLVQAAKLEKQLTGERIALRVAELNAISTGIQLRNSEKESAQQAGETTLEFAKRLVSNNAILLEDRQKIAEQLDQYNGLLDNQANIQEKIQNQQYVIADKQAENAKKRMEALQQEEALRRATERSQSGGPGAGADPLVDAFATRAQIITDIDKRMNDDLVKRNEETQAEIIRRKRDGVEIERQIENEKLGIVSNFAGATSQLFEEQSAGQKILSSAQAIINTYLAATAALASGSKINPVFGIISAAAAVAAGLASVAKINGVQFAEGGWTGPGEKMKAVGVVHADEYVVPKRINNSARAQPHIQALESMRMRGYADGGLVSNSLTQPVNEQMQLANIMKNLPPIEVGVREISKIQNRVRVKERVSKR
jgi:hypothetical protein